MIVVDVSERLDFMFWTHTKPNHDILILEWRSFVILVVLVIS